MRNLDSFGQKPAENILEKEKKKRERGEQFKRDDTEMRHKGLRRSGTVIVFNKADISVCSKSLGYSVLGNKTLKIWHVVKFISV